jgi:hypothetical protein
MASFGPGRTFRRARFPGAPGSPPGIGCAIVSSFGLLGQLGNLGTHVVFELRVGRDHAGVDQGHEVGDGELLVVLDHEVEQGSGLVDPVVEVDEVLDDVLVGDLRVVGGDGLLGEGEEVDEALAQRP